MSNKLSLLVRNQLPDFIKENYETFASFLEAYYEFLEQDGEANDTLVNARSHTDIDDTLDAFVDYFLKQYVYGIPLSVFDPDNTEGKRFLVKYINGLYRAKGSPNALRFLFRLAFDEEIDVVFPADYLFRPSDGKWARTTKIHASIALEDSTDRANVEQLLGKELYGSQSEILFTGIDSYVEQDDGTYLLALDPTYFYESNYEFVSGERLYLTDLSLNANVVISVLNTVVSVDILDGGLGYLTNATITFTPTGPRAAVREVDDETGKIKSVYMITNSSNIPSNTIVSITAPADTRLGTYDVRANVATIRLDVRHGLAVQDTVNLVVLDGGLVTNNYIVSEVVNKSIFRVQKTTANTQGNVRLTYLSNASLAANIQTITRDSDGYGLSVDSQLDTTILIQDSYKWQQYSYIVRSSLDIDTWLDLVKKTLHPAGLELFGEVTIYTDSTSSSVEAAYAGPLGRPVQLPDLTAYDAIMLLLLDLTNANATMAGMVTTADSYYVIELEQNEDVLAPTSRKSAGSTLEVLDQFKFEYGNAFPINIIADYTIESINPTTRTNFQPPSHREQPYRDLANANVIYWQSVNT